jgi:hypothetical protein
MGPVRRRVKFRLFCSSLLFPKKEIKKRKKDKEKVACFPEADQWLC